MTTGEGSDDGLQFALLTLPAGEFKAQSVAPGFRRALLADDYFRIIARFLGQAHQAVTFVEQSFKFAGFAVDRRLGVNGALFFGEGGDTAGFGG